ncbi:hypothetical protein E1B28_009522 [Marasmius oreades]|uniref:Tyrosine specific protein phosphatases domain-containing protein n=1 Tax=Marasmius oreades TaxID=181124 RepID=A0A9P7RVE8_9AGAR|nr:uncharacterized protein E1B28_009522 [Marasmius oreades]KAG7090402.1 hypothetical protein E1B28_009522 [Marasmius oreades]
MPLPSTSSSGSFSDISSSLPNVVASSPKRLSSSSATSSANDKLLLTVVATPTKRPRPIPNSYWATPLLLACEYPWTPKNPYKPKLDALLLAGVRTFIDLTESGELSPYYTELSNNNVLYHRAARLGIPPSEIQYHRFPIRDRSLPSSFALLHSILSCLSENSKAGRISAVHCRGGIGRTGMVIGCWLVQSGVARDGEGALEIISREWRGVEKCKRYPCSPETGEQEEYVRGFKKEVCDGLAGAVDLVVVSRRSMGQDLRLSHGTI